MAVLDELKKYNFNFSKKFGQNFIFDTNLLTSIVLSANLNKSSDVLEIGTGAGTLTKVISENVNNVVSYEIDKTLKEYLTDKFENTKNVKIVFDDILNVNIKDIESHFAGEYHIIANLPYYITTPIIFKFLEEATKLKTLTIMVQQEVADRLVANENSANYGAITASIATMGTAKIIKKINRKMFTPAPNVDSAIVQITIDHNKFNVADRNILKRLIKAGFAMRRKTLANNLKQTFGFSSEKITECLSSINLKETVRGEALSAKDYVDLANYISNNM